MRTLQSLGRFLHIDAAYLAHGSFWLSVGKITSSLAAFGLSLLYARFITKETYGDYRYIISVMGLLGIFALPGLGTALKRSVARGFDKTYITASRIIFLSSLLVTTFGIGLGIFFISTGRMGIGIGCIVAGLITPFAEGLGNWRGFFDGKREFKTKTLANLFTHLFYVCVMVGAIAIIIMFRLPPLMAAPILVGSYLLSDAIPNVVLWFLTRRRISKDSKNEPGAIRYGLHLSVVNIPNTIANYADSVLLHSFFGPASLALYAFAIAPTEQLKAFFATAEDVAFPKFSSTTAGTELKTSLLSRAIRASLFTGIIVLTYILAAPYLFPILFPKYIDAIPYSQVFALSLVLFPFGIFNVAMKAKGNIKRIYIYNVAAPIMQIIALVLLIPIYGLWGAIAGKVFGRILSYFLAFILFRF